MPVIPLVMRYAVKDVKLGSTVIPRNTLLVPHFLCMHISHRYWERPLDFIPVRSVFGDIRFEATVEAWISTDALAVTNGQCTHLPAFTCLL